MRKAQGTILRFEDVALADRVRRLVAGAEARLRRPSAPLETRLANVRAAWGWADPPLPHVEQREMQEAASMLYLGWHVDDTDSLEGGCALPQELAYWPEPGDESGVSYLFSCPGEADPRSSEVYFASMVRLPTVVEVYMNTSQRAGSANGMENAGLTKSHDVSCMLIVHDVRAESGRRRPNVDIHPDRPGVFAHGVTAPHAHVVRSQFMYGSVRAHMEGAGVKTSDIEVAGDLMRKYAAVYAEASRPSEVPGTQGTRSPVTFTFEDDFTEPAPWMVYALASGSRSLVLERGFDDYRTSTANLMLKAQKAFERIERECDKEIERMIENPLVHMPILQQNSWQLLQKALRHKPTAAASVSGAKDAALSTRNGNVTLNM